MKNTMNLPPKGSVRIERSCGDYRRCQEGGGAVSIEQASAEHFHRGVADSHIAVLKERLTKAEAALQMIKNVDCREACDAGRTWEERRNAAWNTIVWAKRIAREGLLP